MGSGPRSREGPRPGLGRRRRYRAASGRLPSAVASGLLRVAPVLGRPLGLLRALAGGTPVGGGGEHRPSPPRLWWAAPWRRWEAEPEPTGSRSASRGGRVAPRPSWPASSVGRPRATPGEQAGDTGPRRLRSDPPSATGQPNRPVLRRSIPGQVAPPPSTHSARPRGRPAAIVEAAGGPRQARSALLPRREATSLLRVAPVLRRPLGLFRASLGRGAAGTPAGPDGVAAIGSAAPPRTGVVRWFGGLWPSTVESSRTSSPESRILQAVQSGVLEVKENRGKAPAGRGANGAATAGGGMSAWSMPGRTNAVSPSTAGVGPAAVGRRSAPDSPTTLRRRSSLSGPASVRTPPRRAEAGPLAPSGSSAPGRPAAARSQDAFPGDAEAARPGRHGRPPVADLVTGALAEARRARRPGGRRRGDGDVLRRAHADSSGVGAGLRAVGSAAGAPSLDSPRGETAGMAGTSGTGGAAGRDGGGGRPGQAGAEDEIAAEGRRPSAVAYTPGGNRSSPGLSSRPVVRPAGVASARPPRLMTARAVASRSVAAGAPGGGLRGASGRQGATDGFTWPVAPDPGSAPTARARAGAPRVVGPGGGPLSSPIAAAMLRRSPIRGIRVSETVRPRAHPEAAARAAPAPGGPPPSGAVPAAGGPPVCGAIPAPLRRLRSDQPALVRRWTETVAGHTAATAGRGDRVPRPAGVGTTAAPRLVTARSPASEAVEAAPSGGFQPADRHPDGSPGSLPVRAGIAPNVGRHVAAARARTEATAGTVEAAQPGGPSLSGAMPALLRRMGTDRPVRLAEPVRRLTAGAVAVDSFWTGSPAGRRSSPLPRVAEATGPTTMAVAVHGRDPVGAPGTRRALPDVADIARSDGSRRSGAIPGPAPRRPSDGSVSPAAAVRRSTQPAPVSTWTSAAPTALLTAHTVASWSHPRGAPGPGVPSGSGGNSPPGAPPAPVWRRPGPRPADSAGTVVHQPTGPASAAAAHPAVVVASRGLARPVSVAAHPEGSRLLRFPAHTAGRRNRLHPVSPLGDTGLSAGPRITLGAAAGAGTAPPARRRLEATAAGQVSSPSGGHQLPPMAPRVVVRQPQSAARAPEDVPGTGTVQRAWQAARPGPASSVSAMSASSALSGHRRGTTDSMEESPPRSSGPPPPLPGGAVNGGGPSAPGGVSAATPTGLAGVDVDRLIEAIEERVLAEIERRGGRYTGLF